VSGPWEQYAAEADGPWSQYAKKEAPPIAGGVNPTDGMGTGERLAAGVGKAGADLWLGLRSLTGNASGEEVAERRRLDAPLMDTGAGFTGNVAGQILGAVAPGGAVAGLGKLAATAGAARAGTALTGVGASMMAPNTIKGAAALGAGFGAAQPAVDQSERGMNALMGLAGSAGGQAAARGLSRVVSPKTDANALGLLQQGITPTPGQLLGGGFKRAEDAATSIPIVGDAIVAGQRRAAGDLNRAAFERVLAPVGEKMPKGLEGREAVAYLGDRLSARYNKLLPGLTLQADDQFMREVTNLQQMMTGSIDQAKAKQFESILQNQVLQKFTEGVDGAPTLTGQTLKAIESDLGQLARTYRSAPDPDQRMLGDALLEVQAALRGNVQRSNPAAGKELQAINEGYANLVRVEGAAAMRGAKEGIFSAAQLGSAVKTADKSRRHRGYARGDALMQDLSDSAEAVLGQNVPDSGTARRMLTAGGAAGGAYLLDPSILLGAGGAAALYSRPGQNALAALIARRPDAALPVGNALERLAPYAALPALGASTQQR
jgi:hypothetical protein